MHWSVTSIAERGVLTALVINLHCIVLLAIPCKNQQPNPIDIRDPVRGVQIDKLPGSRVEYDPFPGHFRITPSSSISIEFRTLEPNGLLFIVGNFHKGDLATAYLSNGRIIFARRCGYGRAFEIHRYRLDDGLWHKAQYVHTTKGGKLYIDGDNPFRQYHMGPCADFTSVLFGGLSPHLEVNRWTGQDVKHRFSGCLRRMRIDNKIPALHPKYHAVSECSLDDGGTRE